jgi:hypothetical protein
MWTYKTLRGTELFLINHTTIFAGSSTITLLSLKLFLSFPPQASPTEVYEEDGTLK